MRVIDASRDFCQVLVADMTVKVVPQATDGEDLSPGMANDVVDPDTSIEEFLQDHLQLDWLRRDPYDCSFLIKSSGAIHLAYGRFAQPTRDAKFIVSG